MYNIILVVSVGNENNVLVKERMVSTLAQIRDVRESHTLYEEVWIELKPKGTNKSLIR